MVFLTSKNTLFGFIIVFMLIATASISAQTYISPKIGFELSEIQVNPYEKVQLVDHPEYTTMKDGFSHFSPVIGAEIKQRLSESSYLFIDASFSYKKFNLGPGWFSLSYSHYFYLPTTIGIEYAFAENFHINLGYFFAFIPPRSHPETGIKSSLSYYFNKHIFISLEYTHGISGKTNARPGIVMHFVNPKMVPVKSIGLTVGYQFQMGKGKREEVRLRSVVFLPERHAKKQSYAKRE